MSSGSAPMKIVDSGEFEYLKRYIQNKGISGARYYDKHCDMHLLSRAVSNDNVEMVTFLLNKKALPNVQSRLLGFTALIFATKYGKHESARVLVSHRHQYKVDVSICDYRKGWNALMHCCESESKDHAANAQTAELLINSEIDLDAQDKEGRTALHIAIRNGAFRIVSLLVERQCSLTIADEDCVTPLILASLMGYTKATELLLLHSEVRKSVNWKDCDGDSALTAAAARGTLKQVQLLPKAGADIFHRNNQRETALIVAERQQRQSIANYLRTMMNKINRSQENRQRSQQDSSSRPPEEVKGEVAGSEIDASIRSDSDLIDELRGLIEAPNDRKITLQRMRHNLRILQRKSVLNEELLHEFLQATVKSGFADGIKLLVAVGAKVNKTDEKGMTVLHHAVLKPNREITQKLLESGADPNVQEAVEGLTPLMMCINEIGHCRKNRKFQKLRKVMPQERRLNEVANLLLKKEIDVSARCKKFEETVVHLAVRTDRRYFVQQLLRQDAQESLLSKNSHMRTPLMLAARIGSHETLETILNKINPYSGMKNVQDQEDIRRGYLEATDVDGNTALILAAKNGNLKSVTALADAGANLLHKNESNEDAIKLSSATDVANFIVRRLQSIERYPFRMVGSQHSGTCVYIAIDHKSDRGQAMGYDENRLRDLLQRQLKYKFRPHTNLTAKAIQELMLRMQQEDFSSSASFLCFVSSHGSSDEGTNKDYVVGMKPIEPRTESAGKQLINLENFTRPIAQNRTLKGKPKVFFYQACRTFQTDLKRLAVKTPNRGKPNQGAERDMLEVLSTASGDAAFRCDKGTLFLQEFCNHMEKCMHSEHLMDILNRLADHLNHRTVKTTNGEECYQIVQMKGNLPKRVFFYQ